MSLDETSLQTLCDEGNRLIDQGLRLYTECGAAYAKASPNAVEDAVAFQSQLQDLFRGLVLKLLHGMVLADRKLSSRELALCRHLFSHLWARTFTPEDAKQVLIKHAEQEVYRWDDLLWPFERLPPFQSRVGELEILVFKLARLAKQVDGTVREAESNYLQWIKSELQRLLHPMQADVMEEPVKTGKKTAQQVKIAQAKQEELKPLPVPAELLDLDTILAELDELVGLAAVKRDVKELVHYLAMQKQRAQHGLPITKISLHAIFSGNPGTGKTTVARLYGKLLGSLGHLSKGHLVETDRGGLVAEYAGQTATKTNARIDEALDGVLFIDEAYSLVNDGEDPYGAEAVQTLLKRMEDQRDRLVVILAGYPEPMENLLCTNPGLASRFARTLTFADYTPVELCRIFGHFCQRDQYALPAATRASLIDGFTWHWKNRTDRFGNGRLARNLFEATLRRLASRLSTIKAMTKAHLSTLLAGDLALDELPSVEKQQLGKHQYESLCLGCAKTVTVNPQTLGGEMTCPLCAKKQAVEWAGVVTGV